MFTPALFKFTVAGRQIIRNRRFHLVEYPSITELFDNGDVVQAVESWN